MKVVALAGGIGGGKFLRGLVRAVPARDVTAIVNTGDDIWMHGLRVCPDLDSVTYWLGDEFDRERGWGRRDESFRATDELRRFDPDVAWFGLGDLDLATHMFRTHLFGEGATLSEVSVRIADRFGVEARVLPMSDDPVATRIDAAVAGRELDLHFQEYWVQRRGRDDVKGVHLDGIERARAAPGVLDAIAEADAVVFAPSNPVVSIGPILAVEGIREAVAARRPSAAGVSGILGGAPLAGMADRLMPALGLEVSAAGVANAYRDVLSGWVIDRRDAELAPRIRGLEMAVHVMDTVMADDDTAARVAAATVELALG
jgi:LPPG:FO 2-phospho-L-lactate transferase